MSLIDREALYEKACGLEAQALAYVGKIANDETRTEEWRIWSAILGERTAFKHDIFDAPEVKPEPKWIPVSERLPEKPEQVLIYACNVHYVLSKYKEIRTGEGIYKMAWVMEDAYNAPYEIKHDVIAWMPLPEPWRGEGEKR